jgi:branched-subunit amino acid transport protein AzlD
VAGKWLKAHSLVRYLGQFLPLAIMALLTVHSMMGKVAQDVRGPWPELTAVVLVALLQWRGRNALLSILLGTGFYVLLIQLGQRSG